SGARLPCSVTWSLAAIYDHRGAIVWPLVILLLWMGILLIHFISPPFCGSILSAAAEFIKFRESFAKNLIALVLKPIAWKRWGLCRMRGMWKQSNLRNYESKLM